MQINRRRALFTMASVSLAPLAFPALALAGKGDEDDDRRNNIQDQPGLTQGQRRELEEAPNGLPESERPNPFAEDDVQPATTSTSLP